MKISIPAIEMPKAFEGAIVLAEVDTIEDVIDSINGQAVMGNVPIAVDSIEIQTHGDTYTSEELKELTESVNSFVFHTEEARELVNYSPTLC